MDLNKNYYTILQVSKISTEKEIKKSYYKLSFTHHPDRGGDASIFGEMTEAYDILCSEKRHDYDSKSRFGQFYDETLELLNVDLHLDHKSSRSKFDHLKKNEILNIQLDVPDDFDGSVEYERWVVCKECGGTGRDFKTKIAIRDEKGEIKGYFDASDGCDFCEGTGKGYNGLECIFCGGHGKTGAAICGGCNGQMRILGKQKLSNITLTGEKTKIEAMGHASLVPGQSGYLLLITK